MTDGATPSTWWDRLRAVLRREATDLKETAQRGLDDLETVIERKQRELEATPHERVDMILEDIEAEQERFDGLEDTVRARTGEAPRPDPVEPPLEPARRWVTVEELDAADAATGRFSHVVMLGTGLRDVIGEDAFRAIADEIAANVFVLDSTHDDPHVRYVRAPTLSVDDVRDLVARTFAAAVSTEPGSPADGV